MYKQKIINAIQSQCMLRICFRRERDDNWVTRDVAPYDVYPRENKKIGFMDDILLGYAETDFEHKAHAVSIYFNNIQNITELDKKFNGEEIRQLLKVRRSPYVSRNW